MDISTDCAPFTVLLQLKYRKLSGDGHLFGVHSTLYAKMKEGIEELVVHLFYNNGVMVMLLDAEKSLYV